MGLLSKSRKPKKIPQEFHHPPRETSTSLKKCSCKHRLAIYLGHHTQLQNSGMLGIELFYTISASIKTTINKLEIIRITIYQCSTHEQIMGIFGNWD